MKRGLVRLSAAALIAAVAATAACSPTQTYNGFLPDRNNEEIPDPQVGVDTRDTVVARFGSPSTTPAFDQGSWYYLSSVQETTAFYQPEITERRVMVIHFTGDTVSGVEKYGLERGRVVNYSDDETPTRGRELGVIEQILGTVGNRPPIRTEEEEGGPRRRN